MSSPHSAGRHIAVLLFPTHGHVVPLLAVVAELVRRGHRVTCFANSGFRADVTAVGAKQVDYARELDVTPPPEFPTGGQAVTELLKIFRQAMSILPLAEAEFADDPPDLLAYDGQLQQVGRLLAHKHGLPTMQFVPTFASNEHFAPWREWETLIAREAPTHPALHTLAQEAQAALAEHGDGTMPFHQFMNGPDPAHVVFIPREFQARGETFDDRHVFVGPCVADPPAAADADWTPPTADPVLFLTLGTSVNDRPEFFRNCADHFSGRGWHVVMTTGGGVDPVELGPLPADVEAHRWVRYADVLTHASVMICAGGMGTVMRGLSAGVPMVVVPYHIEQRLNARQVEELDLGRMLLPAQATPQALWAAVCELGDDPGRAERMRAMRAAVQGAGGVTRAADAVAAVLATSAGARDISDQN